MEPLLNHLAALLQREVDYYRVLIKILKLKKRAIIHGDLMALDQQTEKEERMLYQISSMSRKRFSILEIVAKHLDIPREKISLGKIIDKLSEPFLSRYISLKKDILVTVKEMRRLNENNAYLLENGLKHIKRLNDLLIRGSDNNPVYSKKGDLQSASKKGGMAALNKVG